MDPTACYRDMLTSLQDGDNEAAREHALNLQGWLNRGGFWCDAEPLATRVAEPS